MFDFLLFFLHGVVRRLVTTFYLYDRDSNKQDYKPPNFGGYEVSFFMRDNPTL